MRGVIVIHRRTPTEDIMADKEQVKNGNGHINHRDIQEGVKGLTVE